MRISILSWIRDGLWDLVVTDNNEKEKDKTKKKKNGREETKNEEFYLFASLLRRGVFFPAFFLPWWVPIVLCRFFLFWWFLLFWCFFPAFSRFFFRFAWFLTVFLHG